MNPNRKSARHCGKTRSIERIGPRKPSAKSRTRTAALVHRDPRRDGELNPPIRAFGAEKPEDWGLNPLRVETSGELTVSVKERSRRWGGGPTDPKLIGQASRVARGEAWGTPGRRDLVQVKILF